MSVGVERKPKVGAQFAEHAVRGLVRHLPRKERAALMPRHMLPPPPERDPPWRRPRPSHPLPSPGVRCAAGTHRRQRRLQRRAALASVFVLFVLVKQVQQVQQAKLRTSRDGALGVRVVVTGGREDEAPRVGSTNPCPFCHHTRRFLRSSTSSRKVRN
jgi:hypothetical protein